MKIKPITVSFLDLLFSTLASCITLNVIISLLIGKTSHTVKNNFILIKVDYKEAHRIDNEIILKNKDNKIEEWSFFNNYKKFSLYFKAPSKSGLWIIFIKDCSTIKSLIIMTKDKEKSYIPREKIYIYLK